MPVAAPGERVDAVLTRIRGHRFASASVVAVCEGDRLAGLLTIENLLAASGDTPVGDVMDVHPPTIAGHRDQEHAIWEALRHNEPGSRWSTSTGVGSA